MIKSTSAVELDTPTSPTRGTGHGRVKISDTLDTVPPEHTHGGANIEFSTSERLPSEAEMRQGGYRDPCACWRCAISSAMTAFGNIEVSEVRALTGLR
jgi:hypothetical protein